MPSVSMLGVTMGSTRGSSYWSTPEGQQRRYELRKRERLFLHVPELNALSKKQSTEKTDEDFKQKIRAELDAYNRSAFLSPICLCLEFETSSRQPAPIQSLAKNYLDLLGRDKPANSREKAPRLLYGDDSQVHILSVSCRHGVPEGEKPTFTLTAARLSDVQSDLRYISGLERSRPELFERDISEEYAFDASMESLQEIQRMSSSELATEHGKAMRFLSEYHDRRVVQEHVFDRSQIQLLELSELYDSMRDDEESYAFIRSIRQKTQEWIVQSPYRIELPALPGVGESKSFKAAIKSQIEKFRVRLAHLVQPLRLTVGLEVVVRPKHDAKKAELFDLDNLVRDYLVPEVDRQLSPPSDFLHTLDLTQTEGESELTAQMREARDALPKGVRTA